MSMGIDNVPIWLSENIRSNFGSKHSIIMTSASAFHFHFLVLFSAVFSAAAKSFVVPKISIVFTKDSISAFVCSIPLPILLAYYRPAEVFVVEYEFKNTYILSIAWKGSAKVSLKE